MIKNGEFLIDFPKDVTDKVETPCYLISENVIERNCQVLDYVQNETGAKILLALKAFAMWSAFPIINKYLKGVCASGPIEARLGFEEFRKEVHTFAPAYSDNDIVEVAKYSDFIIFNSVYQLNKFYPVVKSIKKNIEIGVRVNPGHSEVETDLYNPCLPGSRFGLQSEDMEKVELSLISGLHFHALCEQNADVLVRVLNSFEERFSKYIPHLKWVNFGGGHHITRKDYDLQLLIETIKSFRKKYNNITVYLEPGEAVVLNAGVLVSTVLDIVDNGMEIAILDTSAETHMPDVLAMPYKPKIIGAGEPDEFPYTYRLGGISCLAGDIIGDYSFPEPLKRGDRLVFLDMALYSFVKNTTFNGIRLPSLILFNHEKKETKVVRRFGYKDYKDRLS
ncbi:MAG: carboxynorspermidine decarboxylase [Proteobacteria bacterium]|nr:carboxynorspermidine decarboxylase [Pseudomonadota bacterium]